MIVHGHIGPGLERFPRLHALDSSKGGSTFFQSCRVHYDNGKTHSDIWSCRDHIWSIYIQARRAGSRRAPFLCSFLVHHTLVRQRGSKKWAKGTQNGPLKRRQHPELFWDAKRTPKGHQNGHPELTKAPNMAPRGAKMRLKGGQICTTNSFKARRVFETAPGPVLCRHKGPKRVPKWTHNGVQKRIHFQTFSCINLGHPLAPVGNPK